jgi:hypothetical protein
MPAAELPACVFCGGPIGPGEEAAGRAPMAAHAACADAALADDEHWDAISAGAPLGETSDAGPDTEASPGGQAPGRAGCLAMGLLPILGALAALLVLT